jgi:iron complex outermembrane recepter protein
MMKPFFMQVARYSLPSLFFALAAHGQQLHDSGRYDEVINLRPYTVTGGMNPRDPLATFLPLTSLHGNVLDQVKGSNLGETLDGFPGLHASAFAAGSSRPIIRGFDGPRIQILQEGMPVADVAAESPDHALNIDGNFASTIDVIRGPSTLLFGGSAIGGVINVVGGLFPKQDAEAGLSGEVEGRYSSVSEGWTQQADLFYAWGESRLRLQYLVSEADDYKIPGYAASKLERELFHGEEDHEDHDHDQDHQDHEHEHEHDSEETLEQGRLSNSFSDRRELAASYRRPLGRVWSLAVAGGYQDRRYGVPGHSHAHEDEHDHEDEHEEHDDEHEEHHDHDDEHEEHHHDEHGDVWIDMKQVRGDLSLTGSWDNGWVRAASLRVHHSDYEHQEIEGDHVGTSFDKRLTTLRGEIANVFADDITGILGLQADRMRYSNAGNEAFLPNLRSDQFAFFSAQRWHGDWLAMQAGLRLEQLKLKPHDGLDQYSKTAWSAGLGWDARLAGGSRLEWNLSRSARHPSATELYADGFHAATSSYEVGDAELRQETSIGTELRYFLEAERWHLIVSGFFNRFDDYLYAEPTGAVEHGFPVYAYTQRDADIRGMEVEVCWKVIQDQDQQLELSLIADTVRADLRGSSHHLPRSPADRVGLVVQYQNRMLSIRSDFRYAFAVDDVAEHELPTESYRLWNLAVSHPLEVAGTTLTLQLRLQNLLNEEIRMHTSYLKDLAPLPGRNAEIGVRWEF